MRKLLPLLAALSVGLACSGGAGPQATPGPRAPSVASAATTAAPRSCGGPKLKVHFYDVGQALSALVELPDGRHILVDTGESARRPGCGPSCATEHQALLTKLAADLGGRPIDLLWITHPHSDHIGGAADVIGQFSVTSYVDNGRDIRVGEIKEVHDALANKHVPVTVVAPGQEHMPLAGAADVKLTAIAPSSWLPSCTTDRNECSILLRIDYCASSILFTGDAEKEEEALVDPHGPATLLQIGHHGSDTSSSEAFLAKVQPRYAVISAGGQDEGMNKGYCHPRASTVRRLTSLLGGAGGQVVHAFDSADGTRCDPKEPRPEHWVDVPASDRLWATERDRDVVLVTAGDGTFARE